MTASARVVRRLLGGDIPQQAVDNLPETVAALEASIAVASTDGLRPTNAQATDYTLVIGDLGKAVEVNSATAKAVTVPPNASVAFPLGAVIEVVQAGAGAVTVAAGTGVTITGDTAVPAVGASLLLRKTGTNAWWSSIVGVRSGTYVEPSGSGATITDKTSVSNIALRQATSFVLYVDCSGNGNDANDGRSRGSSKATLEAAIAAVPAGGGVIKLIAAQSGYFDVAAPVVITKPLWIEGMGYNNPGIRRTFDGDLFEWKINTGGLRNLFLYDSSTGAARTGAAIKVTSLANQIAGGLVFEGVQITSSDPAGAWERIININGSAHASGARQIFFTNCGFFGARTPGESIRIVDGVHVYFTTCFQEASPTSIRQGVKLINSGVGCVDIHCAGFENLGDLYSEAQYLSWVAGRIGSGTGGTPAVELAASAQNSTVLCPVRGTVTNSSSTSLVRTETATYGSTTFKNGVAIEGDVSIYEVSATALQVGPSSGVPRVFSVDTTGGGTIRATAANMSLGAGANITPLAVLDIVVASTSNATSKWRTASWGSVELVCGGTSPGLCYFGTTNATAMDLRTAGVARIKMTSAGNVLLGAGANAAVLATTATDGYVGLPTCAGTPTGVPTAATGAKFAVYDTTGDKLWLYNGSWKGVALA